MRIWKSIKVWALWENFFIAKPQEVFLSYFILMIFLEVGNKVSRLEGLFGVAFIFFSFCKLRESILIQVVDLSNILFSFLFLYLFQEFTIMLKGLFKHCFWNYSRVWVNRFFVFLLVSVERHLLLLVVDDVINVD
jgi:hypothetical protein